MAEVIDLIGAELRELARSVIDPTAGQPFGLYVFGTEAPGAELARHVERAVFQEAFGNSPELLAEEYGPYEAASLFFAVIDHRRGVPAGMMRIILPSDAGFKSLHDIEQMWGRPSEGLVSAGLALDQLRLWDVATLAVAPEYRGRAASGLVSTALCQALGRGTRPCGVDQVVTILDVPVLRLLQWNFGRPFSEFEGVSAMPYLQSASSLPAFCDVPAWADRLAETDQTLYELFFEGRGLEAAVATPNWETLTDVAARASGLVAATRSA